MNSMINRRKLLAVVITLAMVLSLLPANFAIAKTKITSIDLSKVQGVQPTGSSSYDKKSHSLTVKNSTFSFKLNSPLANGNTITVTLKGKYNGSKGLRSWLIDDNQITLSNQADMSVFPTTPGKFSVTFKYTSTGNATQLFFKGPSWQDSNVDDITITSITIK